jgi:hypothetical protein
MKEVTEHKGFRVGQPIICVLNNRATLTIGKEYTIISLEPYNYDSESDLWITVKNDSNWNQSYHYSRFIDKNEFRKYIIDDILK